jgi:hypothetical protein
MNSIVRSTSTSGHLSLRRLTAPPSRPLPANRSSISCALARSCASPSTPQLPVPASSASASAVIEIAPAGGAPLPDHDGRAPPPQTFLLKPVDVIEPFSHLNGEARCPSPLPRPGNMLLMHDSEQPRPASTPTPYRFTGYRQPLPTRTPARRPHPRHAGPRPARSGRE